MNSFLQKRTEFHENIYREMIEEASSLYERRSSLLHDPEISWRDLAEFEERFEAYIDALVVGEAPALEVCKIQAVEGDSGELHAAVRVFCRQNKDDYVADTWRDFDPHDTERFNAMADALIDDCPDSWLESLTPIFSRKYFNLMPVAAMLFGYRRFKNGEAAMVNALETAPDWVLPSLIWALGRLGGRAAHARIIALLGHPDKMVQNAAAECLLRFGEPKALAWCMSHAMDETAPVTALGLAGGRDAAGVLLNRLKSVGADDALLIALGVLGDLSAVGPLYASLQNETLARAAAIGLYLITGAELFEEVFIQDEIDEDELFEGEVEAYRKEGRGPTKPDGKPYGEHIRRLSQNPIDWESWLGENRSMFGPNQRYRLGRPHSPSGLLQTLLFDTSPYRARVLAIEEFKIRYCADFSIEANMPVVKQEKILMHMQKSVKSNMSRHQVGVWYFNSQAL